MPPPPAGRAEFHPLTVTRVDPLTDDSAAVTFEVPPGLADRFAFAPGQSVTIRRGDERRDAAVPTCRDRDLIEGRSLACGSHRTGPARGERVECRGSRGSLELGLPSGRGLRGRGRHV